MSKNSKRLTAKFLRGLSKHQNLVIAFLLANSFSLGVGLLVGENFKSGGIGSYFGGGYQKITVEEIQTSTPSIQVPGNVQISSKININKASLVELDSLPGIGPVYVQKIVAGRPYSTPLDLVTRKIVPLSTYNKIKDLISVD